MFEKFYRGKNVEPEGRRQGTGIGLYVVRSIVQGHGGKVGARSDGKGFGATLWIPGYPGRRARAQKGRTKVGGRAVSRILLVEDEEHLAAGLAFNLRNAGYDVEVGDRRSGRRSRRWASRASTWCCST